MKEKWLARGLDGGRDLVAVLVFGVGLGAFSVFGEGPGSSRVFVLLANLVSPWSLGAFLVGWVTRAPKRGALAGGLTLLLAMATFYGLTLSGRYQHSPREVVWTVLALLVGPLMGMCGGILAFGQQRGRTFSIVVPSGLLLAEALWFARDRKVWRWNLELEPHRYVDLWVLLGLIVLALTLPLLLVRERSLLFKVYLAIFAAGVAGAAGLMATQWVLLRV